MKDLNAVHLIGRLGQDPEVHYTDTGTARTTFSVATNRTWTDATARCRPRPNGRAASRGARWPRSPPGRL